MLLVYQIVQLTVDKDTGQVLETGKTKTEPAQFVPVGESSNDFLYSTIPTGTMNETSLFSGSSEPFKSTDDTERCMTGVYSTVNKSSKKMKNAPRSSHCSLCKSR